MCLSGYSLHFDEIPRAIYQEGNHTRKKNKAHDPAFQEQVERQGENIKCHIFAEDWIRDPERFGVNIP